MVVLSGIPYTLKDKRNLEQVQKFACRMVSKHWDSGYEDLLELVGLPPLENRRIYLKLCLLYKITHGLCHFPTGIFTPRQISHNFRMNSFQLYQPFVRTNAFQFSFVPHTIYSLHPEHVAGSYSEFKLSNRPYCICSCSYSEFKLYNRP